MKTSAKVRKQAVLALRAANQAYTRRKPGTPTALARRASAATALDRFSTATTALVEHVLGSIATPAAGGNGGKEPPARQAATAAQKVAIFHIEVIKFRPLGSVMTTTIKMNRIDETAEPTIKTEGDYVIEVGLSDASDSSEVLLQFVMDSTKHLLLGIAFSNKEFAGPNNVGQEEFPRVDIDTVDQHRVMTVTNKRSTKASYDYIILLQEVATGQIGIIDPEVRNGSGN